MKLDEKGLWLHFLSRLAFMLPVPVLLLFTSLALLITSAGDTPIELAFMVGAAENPVGFRLLGLALTLLWGSMTLFYIAIAGYFRGEYPIKSTFLGVCGLGFLFPMSAGNLQWTAGLDMVRRYSGAVTVEQQQIIEEIQRTVFQIIESRIDTANLLWGVGMFLFFSMARQSKTVPMFINVLYLLSASVMFCAFFSHIFGYTFPFQLIPLFWLVTLVAHIALGFALLKKKQQTELQKDITP